MEKDWERIAAAAIFYKNVLQRHNKELRVQVKNLEAMVEAMAGLIEKDLTELLDADRR